MFLMRYFIIIATVAMITEIVSFFFYIATTVKETNSFVPSPIPWSLWLKKTRRMMSYIDWLPPKKLLNPLVTRSNRIM